MLATLALVLALARVAPERSYSQHMRDSLSFAHVPVLLPTELPKALGVAANKPYVQAVLRTSYVVSWNGVPNCDIPSCVEFSVVGGAEADTSPAARNVRLDRTTIAKYSAFRCPMGRCQPETLTFERGGVRYEFISKTGAGMAALRTVFRSLQPLRSK